MKNQFKLLIAAFAISVGVFACKGSTNTGDAGTTPPVDSVKTNKDMNMDTNRSHQNTVVDTAKAP